MPLNLNLLPDKPKKSTINLENLPDKPINEQSMTVGGFIGNIPRSALETTKSILTPIVKPRETALGLGAVGAGAIEKIIPGEQPEEQAFSQFKEALYKRYGTLKNIERTAYNDPVGTLLDISALSGGVGALTRIGGLGRLAKGLDSISQISNPANIGYKSIRMPIKAISKQVNKLKYDDKFKLIKAIKPNKNNTNFEPALDLAVPEIKRVSNEKNIPINNIDDLNQVILQAKKDVWSEYKSLMKVAKEKTDLDLTIDGNSVANNMLKSMDKRFIEQNPAQVKRIQILANKYRRKIPLEEAEEFLQSANNELYGYYAKNKVTRAVAEKDPSVGYLVKEAEGLREALYSKLSELTGEDPAKIKLRYGALNNIEKETIGRAIVAGRRDPISLQETINYAQGLGGIAKNMLDFKFGTALEGITQIAASKIMRQANDTNQLIRSVFGKVIKKTPSKFKGITGAVAKYTPGITPTTDILYQLERLRKSYNQGR